MLFNDIFIFCSVMPQLQWFHMEYGMTPLTRKNSGKSNAHCTYWKCLRTKKRSGAGIIVPFQIAILMYICSLQAGPFAYFVFVSGF